MWFYYEGNDLVDLQTERKSALLTNYLRTDFLQPDLARQRDIDRAIVAEMPRLAAMAAENAAKLFRNTIRSRLTAFVKLTSVRDRLAPIVDTDPDAIEAAADFEQANMTIFRDILLQAKGRVDSWQGQLYFVYLPEWTRYTRYTSRGKTKRDDVLELVRAAGDSDHRHRPGVPGARRPTVVVSVPRLRPLHRRRPSPGRRRSSSSLLE